MSRISISHAHSMSISDLKVQVEQLADSLKRKYGASSTWLGDQEVKLKASGVDGKLTLTENNLSVDVKLGMLTSFMKPKIEAEIKDYLAANIS